MYTYAVIHSETKVVRYFMTTENLVNPEEEPYLILVDGIHETWIQRKKWDEESQTFVDVSLSETVTSNSLEFTHIDADGTKHWLDEYINDLAAANTSDITAKTNVTVTRGSDASSSSGLFGYTCQYIPYLNMCFVRVYAQPSAAFSADTEYEIATISNSTYHPASMMALSNYCQKELSAYINTDGKIVVRPYESINTGYGIRLAGFWFCE